jgi:hypothetical protein
MGNPKKDDDDIGPGALFFGLLLLMMVGWFYIWPIKVLDKAKAMITIRKDKGKHQ